MTGLIDERRAVDIVYLNYSLTEKLLKYGLDEQLVNGLKTG